MDAEILKLELELSELDNALVCLTHLGNVDITLGINETYETVTSLIDEIKEHGVCKKDVTTLTNLGLLQAGLESEYTEYKTSFNHMEVGLEAENNLMSKLIKALLAGLVALLGYILTKIFGGLFGGGAGGSGGSTLIERWTWVVNFTPVKDSELDETSAKTGLSKDVLKRLNTLGAWDKTVLDSTLDVCLVLGELEVKLSKMLDMYHNDAPAAVEHTTPGWGNDALWKEHKEAIGKIRGIFKNKGLFNIDDIIFNKSKQDSFTEFSVGLNKNNSKIKLVPRPVVIDALEITDLKSQSYRNLRKAERELLSARDAVDKELSTLKVKDLNGGKNKKQYITREVIYPLKFISSILTLVSREVYGNVLSSGRTVRLIRTRLTKEFMTISKKYPDIKTESDLQASVKGTTLDDESKKKALEMLAIAELLKLVEIRV